jgi:hypothetical protein
MYLICKLEKIASKIRFIKHKSTRHLLPACGSRAANLTRVLT